MNKKYILILLALCSLSAAGQEQKRCSSAEYLEKLESADPALAQKRQEREAAYQLWKNTARSSHHGVTVTIPVVFHVLYYDSSQYLDDSIILSQLAVINEDYRRLNSDSIQTPLAFRPLAADCEIEFCLAQRTPAGLPTDGIIHKQTTVSAFSDFDECKFNVYGGDDAWDASKYLNVWVAAFTNPNFLGLGTFPNSVSPQFDGIVINYKACGRIGSHLMTNYNRGRSLTHEIGHWLSLLHTWGDDGSGCSADDMIADTPMQGSETYGCPSYPELDNCSSTFPGIMFMNFMDYTDDECMNVFTEGQKDKMLFALNVDRASILTSNGCLAVGIEETGLNNYFTAFPNPAASSLTLRNGFNQVLHAEVSVHNMLGKQIAILIPVGALQSETALDISMLSPGMYWLRIKTAAGTGVVRFVKN